MPSDASNAVSTLGVRATPAGAILPVHAQPGARRNGITGVHNGRLKIAVTQVAEKGKANKELIKLLSKQLGVSKSQVSLLAGETSPLKEFEIAGLSAMELESRIRALLQDQETSRSGS